MVGITTVVIVTVACKHSQTQPNTCSHTQPHTASVYLVAVEENFLHGYSLMETKLKTSHGQASPNTVLLLRQPIHMCKSSPPWLYTQLHSQSHSWQGLYDVSPLLHLQVSWEHYQLMNNPSRLRRYSTTHPNWLPSHWPKPNWRETYQANSIFTRLTSLWV